MSVHQLHRAGVLALGLLALGLPAVAGAQTREVVAKQVSVGRTEATLLLEFADATRLEIAFDDGRVLIDGDEVGTFDPGSDLEEAWRDLLARAVQLDDGPLSRMLVDWTVPASLAGELADVAGEIDQALERAVEQTTVRVDASDGSVSVSVGDQGELISALIGSVGRFGLLGEALEDLDSNVTVYFEEDLDVPAGSVVEGSFVVVDGRVRIEGEVDGDLVIIGGELDLRDGGRVDGEVRVVDTRIVRNEGSIQGRIVDVLDLERDVEAEVRDRIRDEVEEEIRRDVRRDLRDELRAELRDAERGGGLLARPFRAVARAVGGVVEKLFLVLVLALVGAGVLAFGGDNLDVISETARRSPGRAATVGVAGTILLLPVWILGTVALAVSIIFIPVAVAWLPLFPLAACAAALVGYLAVARNTGEWLAEREYPGTGWIRASNSWMAMVGGLVGLMLAFIAGHVIAAAPFLNVLSGLLVFVGGVITFVAIQVGFGAVLLTRGGRRKEWSPIDPDVAWEDAMATGLDDTPRREAGKGEGSDDA